MDTPIRPPVGSPLTRCAQAPPSMLEPISERRGAGSGRFTDSSQATDLTDNAAGTDRSNPLVA
jgi:hypothetical protein